ncbi:Intracellular distribution of mitochondria, partial [Kickxella alabastrina]
SVVPGIFRRQDTTQIVYGSVDNGVTVGADAEFHRLLAPVAKALHFGEHVVADAEGTEFSLYTSSDVKGLTGTDGRKYMLDLYRMSPVDVEFLEAECTEAREGSSLPVYPHKLVLLRPELLDIFWETSVRKAVQEYAAEKAKRSEEAGKGEDAKKPEEGEPGTETAEAKKPEDAMADFDFSLEFTPDAFTHTQQKGSESGGSAEPPMHAAVRSASKFLREVGVPAFAHELASYTTSPLSGDALVTAMHQRGINMRYLGQIAALLPGDIEIMRNVRRLVIFEMISRAIKHVVRRLFRATPAHLHGEVFALVANGLVGTHRCTDPTQLLSAEAHAVRELRELTPRVLAEEIRAQVALRFRFDLATDFVETLVSGSERILLREATLKVGAQLALRQYHFEKPQESAVQAEVLASLGLGHGKLTKVAKRQVRELIDAAMARQLVVEADDVLNFVAKTKVSTHNSSFADEAFEAGRMSLEQGQRTLGLELLLESLALHEQT